MSPLPDIPAVNIPATGIPAVHIPAVDIPAVHIPAVHIPAVDVPTVDIPATGSAIDPGVAPAGILADVPADAPAGSTAWSFFVNGLYLLLSLACVMGVIMTTHEIGKSIGVIKSIHNKSSDTPSNSPDSTPDSAPIFDAETEASGSSEGRQTPSASEADVAEESNPAEGQRLAEDEPKGGSKTKKEESPGWCVALVLLQIVWSLALWVFVPDTSFSSAILRSAIIYGMVLIIVAALYFLAAKMCVQVAQQRCGCATSPELDFESTYHQVATDEETQIGDAKAEKPCTA